MLKYLGYIALLLVILAGIGRLAIEAPQVQMLILRPVAASLMASAAEGLPQPSALQAYVCGRSSPIPAPGTAQACIAIMTPQHLFLVDVGAGGAAWLAQGRLPMARLQGVFVTHFHSDHIAEIPEVNLASWVAGRPEPLTVYGPTGVRQVVAGLNQAYALDRSYRTAHHGAVLMPPSLGELDAVTIEPGLALEDGGLKVTAYLLDHGPVQPAVGYRFDYGGRSIFVSGDGNVSDATREAAQGLDLMLHDALSQPIITALSDAAYAAGLDRNGKVLADVMNYHASTEALAQLIAETQIGMVALYHQVPAPRNLLMRRIFLRDLPSETLLAEEGQWFVLPADGTRSIQVR